MVGRDTLLCIYCSLGSRRYCCPNSLPYDINDSIYNDEVETYLWTLPRRGRGLYVWRRRGEEGRARVVRGQCTEGSLSVGAPAETSPLHTKNQVAFRRAYGQTWLRAESGRVWVKLDVDRQISA
jgi:hypothetical protein